MTDKDSHDETEPKRDTKVRYRAKTNDCLLTLSRDRETRDHVSRRLETTRVSRDSVAVEIYTTGTVNFTDEFSNVSVTEVGVAGWAWSTHKSRPEFKTVNK